MTETCYPSGDIVPPHSHDATDICVVLSGGFAERLGSRSIDCDAGSLIVHQPGEVHEDSFGAAGGRCFNVQLGEEWERRFNGRLLGQSSRSEVSGYEVTWLSRRLYAEFCRADDLSCIGVEGLALAFFAALARPRVAQDAHAPWMGVALEYVHEHYRTSISLGALAATIGIHPAHLARTFRKRYGCSLGEFVRQLRIEWACEQLATTVLPLSELAHSAGFADHAHFTRTFRRLVGVTPSAYASRLRR